MARLDSPQDLGEEALTEWTLVARIERSDPWTKVIVVVEYYCILINIIDGAPQPPTPHLASTE